MHITVKLSLKLDDSQKEMLIRYEEDMCSEILRIVEVFNKKGRVFNYPYKEISNMISWNSKCVVLRQAKQFYFKLKGKKKYPFSYSSIWNENSYKIMKNRIIVELGRTESSRKLSLPFYEHEQQVQRLNQGDYKNLTIIRNKKHWYAYVIIEISSIEESKSNAKMGIDVGIKIPAVAYTENGKIKFFGNGRERAYVQRRYRKHIQKMQEYKQIEHLRDYEHKLHRKLNYFDHKVSKDVIDFAIRNNIGIIIMERLTFINKSFDIEISKDIYLWSYHRVQKYIAYKGELAGIKIVYVDPRNTSKRCPLCRKINSPRDRNYTCKCGYHSHRDIVGARNIMLALDS